MDNLIFYILIYSDVIMIKMIDYGLNGNDPGEANYLVSNQLVTYGAPNFNQDAALVEIKRPSRRVEYERINPACNLPIVLIRNTGVTELTNLTITYWIDGGESLSYEWNGNLGFMEEEEVDEIEIEIEAEIVIGEDFPIKKTIIVEEEGIQKNRKSLEMVNLNLKRIKINVEDFYKP